jgi:hypothetical protein
VVWTVSGLDIQWSGQSVVWTVSGLGSQWCKYVSVSVRNTALRCYTQSLFLYGTYPADLSVPLKEGLSQVPQDTTSVLSL